MRALVVHFAILATACGHDAPLPTKVTETASPAATEPSKWRPRVTPPGLRLPDTVEPLGYKLRLEIDPDRDTFRGHVDIRARVKKGIDVIWLHAKELEISRAQVRVGSAASESLTIVPEKGDEMLGFTAGRMIYPSEITLAFDYTGHVRSDTNGLFRQQADKKWFVFSQGQAVFTRLFVPCFDEPRFKTPWQLSLVVPASNVALSNAPAAIEQVLADGRKEVTFRELGPLPSYLVAIAVGPFTLVDGGTVGANTPFRIAVWPSRAGAVKHAVKRVGRLLHELESYVDQRLPWPKLDFVAVPQFFGAMENVGLVTFESHILFDESDGEYGFARVAAHELVHQWFGNLVTPQWWDELWLSEAFASFLGDKIAELAGETGDPVLVQQLSRAEALAADASTPLPLRRRVVGNSTVDDTFDEIAYQKGASVLAMFEAYMEPDKFRAALRELLRANAHRSITTDSFVAAVRTIDDSAADAVRTYATHAGAPIVEMELACGASGAGANGPGVNSAGANSASSSSGPRVIATTRDGAVIPVCVRYPGAGGPSRACAIVSARTEIPLAATACPAWIAGNANGTGYYEVVAARSSDAKAKKSLGSPDIDAKKAAGSEGADANAKTAPDTLDSPDKRDATKTSAPDANARLPRQLDKLLPAERMALGADSATAMTRGDLSVRDALVLAKSLFASKDPYARLGAVAIVRAVDPIVDDATRSQWTAWLAKRLPPLGRAAKAVDRELVTATAELTSLPGGTKAFDKVVALARSKQGDDQRTLLSQLGGFGSAVAPRIVALLLVPDLPAATVLQSLFEQLARGDTRTAAWTAVRAKLPEVMARITPRDARDLVSATSSLCDATARAQVAAAFEPRAADIPDGATTIAAALASIDRCVTRAKTAGDLKIVLRAL